MALHSLICYNISCLNIFNKTIHLNIVKIFTHFLCNMGNIETGKLSQDFVGGLRIGIPSTVGTKPNGKMAI